MALEIQLSIDSVSEDAGTLTVLDSTGAYSLENETGYGAPNEERNSLQVFLLAERVTSCSRDAQNVTEANALSPATAAKWSIKVPVDGVIELLLVAAKPAVPTTLYGIDAVVASNNKLYKSLLSQTLTDAAELSDSSKWKPIETITDYPIGVVDTGAYYNMLPYLFYHHTDICRRNKTLAMSKVGVERMGFESVAKEYLWLTVSMEAALISAGFGDFAEAGDALEEAAQVCKDELNCNC